MSQTKDTDSEVKLLGNAVRHFTMFILRFDCTIFWNIFLILIFLSVTQVFGNWIFESIVEML